MTEYRMITRRNDPELIDFINYVFSYSDAPTDFIQLLPKVYSAQGSHEVVHLAVKEDNRIRAVVSILIFSMVHQGKELRVGFIGNVAVHPYSRGKGYMKELMRRAEIIMRQRGCDLAALSGQRQRYEYFGYYQACPEAVFTVTRNNLRHILGPAYQSPLMCREVASEDAETIQEIYKLYNAGPVTGRSELTFEADCRSWGGKLISIQNGENVIGYAVTDGGLGGWTEAHVPPQQYADAMLAYMNACHIRKLRLEQPLYEQEAIDVLTEIAEEQRIENSCMLRILCWEKVLAWASALRQTQDGSAELAVQNVGTYRITIQNGEFGVCQIPDTVPGMTEKEAMRLLFSPLPVRGRDRFPENWFPLSLWIAQADMF